MKKTFALLITGWICITHLRDINVGASHQARNSLNLVRAPFAGHPDTGNTFFLLHALVLLALSEK